MQRALRFCAHQGCRTLVEQGKCPRHTVEQEHGRTNWVVRRWYRTARWFRLRDQVKVEEPYCRECLAEGRRERTEHVDHIEPHRGDAVLFWSRANLQGLCAQHHGRKTSRGE